MESAVNYKNRTGQLVLVIGFLALHFLFQSPYFLYIAFGIGLLSLLSAKAGNMIVLVWEKLGLALGWLNARILLSLVFYLLLTPLALLNRLFGKSAIPKFTAKEETHFKVREHQFTKADLEEPW